MIFLHICFIRLCFYMPVKLVALINKLKKYDQIQHRAMRFFGVLKNIPYY